MSGAIDLLDAVRTFMQTRKDKGCRPSTLYCYEHACRMLVKHFGPTRPLNSISIADAEDFKRARLSTPQGANKEITTARAVWKVACTRGLVHANPWLRVDCFPTGGHDRRALTRQEVARIFAAIRRMEDTGRLLRGKGTMFKLVFYCGMRIMEAARLKWEDVHLKHPDGPRIHLRNHKTSRHRGGRWVELPMEAAALLQALPRHSEWCFPPRGAGTKPSYPWAKWRDVMRMAEVELPKNQATHSARISFATRGLDLGVLPGDLMEALGHCDSRSTMRYAKFSHVASRRATTAIAAAMFGDG